MSDTHNTLGVGEGVRVREFQCIVSYLQFPFLTVKNLQHYIIHMNQFPMLKRKSKKGLQVELSLSPSAPVLEA